MSRPIQAHVNKAMGRSVLHRRALTRLCTSILLSIPILVGGPGVARASAKPGFTVIPPGQYAAFSLRGTKGFRISLFAYARQATLEAEQPREQASVVYRVRRHGRQGRINARFGRLGSIHMRWQPTEAFEASSEPQGDCRGRRPLVQRGFFVGRFAFRAEGAFTEARAARVPGLKVRSFRNVCHGPGAGSEPARQPEETLLAVSRQGRRSVRFRTSSRASGGGRIEEFEGDVAERIGGLSIDRSVLTGGAAAQGEFSFEPTARTARVEPPVPFVGSGALNEAVAGEDWTGDLAVKFPGLGRISLAGSGFEAQLTAEDGGLKSFGE
jgi:hypothetical protein